MNMSLNVLHLFLKNPPDIEYSSINHGLDLRKHNFLRKCRGQRNLQNCFGYHWKRKKPCCVVTFQQFKHRTSKCRVLGRKAPDPLCKSLPVGLPHDNQILHLRQVANFARGVHTVCLLLLEDTIKRFRRDTQPYFTWNSLVDIPSITPCYKNNISVLSGHQKLWPLLS